MDDTIFWEYLRISRRERQRGHYVEHPFCAPPRFQKAQFVEPGSLEDGLPVTIAAFGASRGEHPRWGPEVVREEPHGAGVGSNESNGEFSGITIVDWQELGRPPSPTSGVRNVVQAVPHGVGWGGLRRVASVHDVDTSVRGEVASERRAREVKGRD
ncbi:MAG: hypothetical protein HY906_25500 [Deltaproteobacteria bacterium]|nr:hypothetical protein [Deltaproteobacteria bacterium]